MPFPTDDDLKGSEVRLWHLIEERTRPGADKERIDERIWDLFGEEWTVMFTDLSGFSRNVAAFGIIHFLQVILEQKKLLLPIVVAHDGILIKIEADSLLLLFKRPARALACAIAMQHACDRANLERTPEEKILLCIGIGFGRILRIGDKDVWGREVNAASKLGEDTAKAGEILVTDAVRVLLGDEAGLPFEDLDVPVPGSDRNYRVGYRRT
jgi:class 3 adenylate cyclase